MPYDTYNNLIQLVKDIAEDDSMEFSNYIPNAISLAEKRLTKELDTIAIKKNVDAPVTVGSRTVPKPAGFRFVFDAFLYDVSTGKEKRLLNATDDYIRDYWPNQTLTREPKYFSQDFDNESLLLGPTPDKNYTLRLSIGADVTPLTVANQTNYFTTKCGEVLYYATMVEMMRFAKNDEGQNNFEASYTNALNGINNQGRRARRDDGMAPNNSSGGNTLKGEV